MTFTVFGRAFLIALVSVALALPARGESIDTAEKQIIAGIVVVSVAVGILATVLVVHYRHKHSAITGCVITGANGASVTDEKDKKTYVLSGNPAGIQTGDRMTLLGERKPVGGSPGFEARSVAKDFGACRP